MSSILSRPRHRLTAVLPSKRRILVLTDTPRLLCLKEERDRVVVKSALLFSGGANVPTPTPPVNAKPPTHVRGRSIGRWKQQPSTGSTGSAAGSSVGHGSETTVVQEPATNETIQSVETKGEKSFVVQTVSLTNPGVAWVLTAGAVVQGVYLCRRELGRSRTMGSADQGGSTNQASTEQSTLDSADHRPMSKLYVYSYPNDKVMGVSVR